MTTDENTRSFTVDELEEMDVPWGNYVARDQEDKHRWYTLWRLVFQDPKDGTYWAFLRAEEHGESGEIPWYYAYGGFERDSPVICRRVKSRVVTVVEWVAA